MKQLLKNKFISVLLICAVVAIISYLYINRQQQEDKEQ